MGEEIYYDNLNFRESLRYARNKLKLAKSIKCKCSGFIIQYEGGCQCEREKSIRAAQDEIDKLIELA